MNWFKGKFTGHHGFYHSIKYRGFPVKFPLNQSIEHKNSPEFSARMMLPWDFSTPWVPGPSAPCGGSLNVAPGFWFEAGKSRQ